MMEESGDRKEEYYQVAKRLRTEQETGVKELEDGKEEEDSAAEEAAGNGCTENRRSGAKVRHTILMLLYLNTFFIRFTNNWKGLKNYVNDQNRQQEK